MRKVYRALLAAALAAGATTVFAQSDWPSKPLVLIVPFPPGGGTDAFARPLTVQLSKQLGQQVVIDNRGGAGGTIGASAASRAPGDGYSYLIGAVHHAIAPSVYRALDYNIERDLIPITSLAHVPQVVVVNPQKIKAASLKEFVALAQKESGRVTFGSAGSGTSHHLAGELFQIVIGAKMLHVPYKGAGAGIDRPDRRPDRLDVRRSGVISSTYSRRQTQGAGCRRSKTRRCFSGHTHDRRSRAAGVCREYLVRHLGAQGNATRDNRSYAARSCAVSRHAGNEGNLVQSGRRCRR